MGDVINIFGKDKPDEEIELIAEYEDEYEDPDGSIWIIGIDVDARVFVVDFPNIDPSFLEAGSRATDVGLPYELPELSPGVYEAVCRLQWERYTEGNKTEEDWWFEIIETTPMFIAVTGEFD